MSSNHHGAVACPGGSRRCGWIITCLLRCRWVVPAVLRAWPPNPGGIWKSFVLFAPRRKGGSGQPITRLWSIRSFGSLSIIRSRWGRWPSMPGPFLQKQPVAHGLMVNPDSLTATDWRITAQEVHDASPCIRMVGISGLRVIRQHRPQLSWLIWPTALPERIFP